MPSYSFRLKCQTVMGERVVMVGADPILGDWDPHKSKVAFATDEKNYPWWLGSFDLPAGRSLEFKFAVLKGSHARWETSIKNRQLQLAEGGMEIEAQFDSGSLLQRPGSSSSLKATSPRSPPVTGNGSAAKVQPASKPAPEAPQVAKIAAPAPAPPRSDKPCAPDAFADRISGEDQKRKSWRNKLDLSRVLLESGEIASLKQLAMLQAYLTFISSGQIKCEEDGGHHRPCAHAEASRRITQLLWQLAARGDAERFVARRVFPSLPSYAEQFTVSVPMTRIRDIAHRNDIPSDLKQEIKHKLQNKLHRCADPGDLVTCERILEKVRREGTYSKPFVEELEIFYKELKEFFNASGLDDMAMQLSQSASHLKGPVELLLGLKKGRGDVLQQMAALTELRRVVSAKCEEEQSWLLLDLELEKYAFVLLSQLAGELEGAARGSPDWWKRLLAATDMALEQVRLSKIAPEECEVVAKELKAAGPDVADRAKAPFAPQRVAATADRALRICFSLTQALEEAYAGVPALGQALRIDGHAVAVFVEAEMRASVLFQVSKFIQLAMQCAKAAAGLPPWTAIAAGSCCGRVVRCESLNSVWSLQLPAEGAIVFCTEAGGDEEIPHGVRGIVVSRDLPVLSHLALRARQLGVVFSCTAEARLFHELRDKAPERSAIRLTVEATGSTRVEGISDATLASEGAKGKKGSEAKGTSTDPKKVGKVNLTVDKVVAAREIGPETAGAKAASSGKLEALAADKGAKFLVPKGLAVPFGVMRKQVAGPAINEALAALQKALDQRSPDIESKAASLREAVERSEVPARVVDALIAELPKGTERVAVRSSANSEDLEGVSGAGLHDSVLGVSATDKGALAAAIRKVWGSLFTLRAVQSRHAAGLPLFEGVAMGVLVQPMVALQGRAYAFIAFSKDVVAGDSNSVYLEVCVGLGETLASANEPGTPYRLVVSKTAPNSVKILSLASFSYGLQDAPGGPSRVRVDYSSEQLSTDRGFLEQLAKDVAAVAVKVEEGYGVAMDMEGVVLERSTGREVHLVQARPIVEG